MLWVSKLLFFPYPRDFFVMAAFTSYKTHEQQPEKKIPPYGND